MVRGRIDWVDIYKGIAIILVVLGHATGRFNGSIYQFHMAAFFYISGYTAIKSLKKESLIEFVVKKLMTLILPCFTMTVIFGGLYSIAERIGVLQYWDGADYAGIRFLLREFLIHGNSYISCLGATWFIFVLFGIFLLHKLCYMLLEEKYSKVYILISFGMYILGAYFIAQGKSIRIWWFDVILILLTQFFFMLGIWSKKYDVFESITGNTTLMVTGTIITAVLMYELSKIPGAAVDMASHSYYDLALNSATTLNGIIFIVCMANTFEKIGILKNILISLGKNSLGILFLHFAGMKFAYCVMAAMKIVSWDFVCNLVPTPEVGNQFWWLITPISLVFSMIVWTCFKKVPILKVLCGEARLGSNKNVKSK